MERIDHWLVHYLADRGLAERHTYYSKLSFLRDAVATWPGTAPNH
ncbi:hypothetical protein [Streptomyces sp. NPDC050804]